jgi:hypothetical protein
VKLKVVPQKCTSFVAHTNIVMDGSTSHHVEDQLVQGTVGVDASDLTSLTSRDALDFGLEPILSAISEDGYLGFHVSYESSGEVHEPNPYSRNIWQTIVKSVSKDHNLCIDITRRSEASQPTVSLTFSGNFNAEEEISVMFMEEFANAIRSNPRIVGVFIHTTFGQELDRTLVTRFGTLVVNMFEVMLKSPSLQFANLISFGQGGRLLDRAAIESLASALCNNLTLGCLSIANNRVCYFDTEGLELFLKPLMIGGEGSYQGLKILELNGTGIDDERAEVVASMLRRNTSLTCISLYSNIIGPHGAACIAEALYSNNTLQQLDISDNPMGAAGLKALVASLTPSMADGDLQPNSSLTHLYIWGDLGVEDMELLETLVRQNTSLLSLNLSDSSLLRVADNVIQLLEALKSNKCLLTVSLVNCHGVVGRRVLGTIFDLLEVNYHLKISIWSTHLWQKMEGGRW